VIRETSTYTMFVDLSPTNICCKSVSTAARRLLDMVTHLVKNIILGIHTILPGLSYFANEKTVKVFIIQFLLLTK
jgi:hypothetical protein